jgi:hypothetical protein
VQTVPTHRRSRSQTWWWAVVLVALASVVAVVVVVVVIKQGDDAATPKGTTSATATPSAGATQPQAHRVAQFSGVGDTTSKTFKVALNWEIRWTAPTGSAFTVDLLKSDGTSRGQILRAASKTRGSTFVGEAGEFKLKVTSSKPWTIQIFSPPLTK